MVSVGASLCDALLGFDTTRCAAVAGAAERERGRRLLSGVADGGMDEADGEPAVEARPPTRRDVLNLAWPHAHWLVLGCIALAVRLPFSLAMPHYVSEVVGALILQDLPAARSAIGHSVIACRFPSKRAQRYIRLQLHVS
jgi:hypothetical protein